MSEQMAFDYSPPRARRSDPPTAHGAAVIAINQAPNHRAKALEALRTAGERGMNDFELSAATGIPPTSIGVRRGQLCKAGLVVPRMVIGKKPHPVTGSLLVQDTRPSTTTGSPAGVYVAVEFQRADARPAE